MDALRAGILAEGTPAFLVRRSRRAIGALGATSLSIHAPDDFRAAFESGIRWFVRAGAFPHELPAELAPSATGRPVVLFGAPLVPHGPSLGPSELTQRATELLRSTGGDVGYLPESLPFASLVFCDRFAPHHFDDAAVSTIESLLGAIASTSARVVHASWLDAGHAEEVRVAEIVTSLQLGGAEVVARALASELPKTGIAARLFGLGSPTRTRMASLEGELDLAGSRLDASRRVARLVEELVRWGADVAHAHLFGPDVLGALAQAGFPPLVTIHNAQQGFPVGTATLDPAAARLVVGCARAVERELRASGMIAPLRTVVNGIDARPFQPDPTLAGSDRARALRREWGVASDAIVLLVVANPRPQKRLDRVAPIAASLASLSGRAVQVVWAGAASDRDRVALRLADEFVRSFDGTGVGLTALGAISDLAPIHRACDALLTTSDWEGLSLAQLEAVASGLPVVATDVGGTSEIAARCPPDRFVALPIPASIDDFVHALADRLRPHGSSPLGIDSCEPEASHLPEEFSVRSMVRGYARLARRAASAPPIDASRDLDLVLVTNNLSPGGAQSSARRLLVELLRRGRRVAAVTLQEDDRHPTPGLAALRAAGVPVWAIGERDPELSARAAFERIDSKGTRALVFWNAIAEHKILLAEQCFDAPVFDVSPGEMYFDSLARYFEHPRVDISIDSAIAYGSRLEGAIVKFDEECERASKVLGCPVHVVPNGVPVLDRVRERTSSGGFHFGTAVRIHPHKRLDLLISAFREVQRAIPDARLSIAGAADAGADDHLAELRRDAADLPVHWVGFVPDPAPFLATLDGFVLVAEPAGCPNASLEAMGAGLPTIATDVGGIREQLEGGAGWITDREDPADLAKAMKAVASNPDLARQLATCGLARARCRFSIERMADDYERIFFA